MHTIRKLGIRIVLRIGFPRYRLTSSEQSVEIFGPIDLTGNGVIFRVALVQWPEAVSAMFVVPY